MGTYLCVLTYPAFSEVCGGVVLCIEWVSYDLGLKEKAFIWEKVGVFGTLYTWLSFTCPNFSSSKLKERLDKSGGDLVARKIFNSEIFLRRDANFP